MYVILRIHTMIRKKISWLSLTASIFITQFLLDTGVLPLPSIKRIPLDGALCVGTRVLLQFSNIDTKQTTVQLIFKNELHIL